MHRITTIATTAARRASTTRTTTRVPCMQQKFINHTNHHHHDYSLNASTRLTATTLTSSSSNHPTEISRQQQQQLQQDTQFLYQFQHQFQSCLRQVEQARSNLQNSNESFSSSSHNDCQMLLARAREALDRRPVPSQDALFSINCFRVSLLRNQVLLHLLSSTCEREEEWEQADRITTEQLMKFNVGENYGKNDNRSNVAMDEMDASVWERYFFNDLNSALSMIARVNAHCGRLDMATMIGQWLVDRTVKQVEMFEREEREEREEQRLKGSSSISYWIEELRENLKREVAFLESIRTENPKTIARQSSSSSSSSQVG